LRACLSALILSAHILAAHILAALVLAPSVSAGEARVVRSVTVDGTAFRVLLADGSLLPQASLPGTVLVLGTNNGPTRRIRIDAVASNPGDPAQTTLYTMSEQHPGSGAWENICEPDPDGRRLAFPVPGSFSPDMRYTPSPGRFFITCTGGAEGKCIRFGYRPSETAPDGASLAAHFQACVRLVRADYCGDGAGHTRDGTLIDLYDRIGVQRPEPGNALAFEAAFNADGAVCVRQTRLPDVLSLDQLRAQCPRLAGRLGADCSENAPALLFVRSRGR